MSVVIISGCLWAIEVFCCSKAGCNWSLESVNYLPHAISINIWGEKRFLRVNKESLPSAKFTQPWNMGPRYIKPQGISFFISRWTQFLSKISVFFLEFKVVHARQMDIHVEAEKGQIKHLISKWRVLESLLFRFRAFALIVHQKQLLLASSAAVDLTQTGNYNRNFTAFYKHTGTEMTSLLSTRL